MLEFGLFIVLIVVWLNAAQVAEAERNLQLVKSQLMLAQAKQQSLKLQIKYAQVRGPHWCACSY